MTFALMEDSGWYALTPNEGGEGGTKGGGVGGGRRRSGGRLCLRARHGVRAGCAVPRRTVPLLLRLKPLLPLLPSLLPYLYLFLYPEGGRGKPECMHIRWLRERKLPTAAVCPGRGLHH